MNIFEASIRPGFRRRFRRRVLIPVVGVFCIVAAICAGAVALAIRDSDKLSVERQAREVSLAIAGGLDELARTQEGAAVWDSAVLEFRKPAPDLEWVDVNIGTWLHQIFRHDAVLVLDGRDRPIYASISGRRASPSLYMEAGDALPALVERVRGRANSPSTPHERLPGQPLHPNASVRTGASAVHATELTWVQGRPAAVSVMRIVPLTQAVSLQPDDQALMISVRFLDGSFLQELEHQNLIEAPRFRRDGALAPGERRIAVTSSRGERLGYLTWRPELPGTALLATLLPLTGGALLILGLTMGLLTWRVQRLMQAEAAALKDLRTAHLELKASEAQAHHIAFHDALTGLPNRALFNERADQALARVRAGGAAVIMLLDLDRFKRVNDTWGHLAGDALIQEFGRRLARIVGPDATIARLGGDEFAVLLAGDVARASAHDYARRIVAAVREPFEVLGNQAHVGVSIGFAAAPEAGADRAELMRKADIALYRAKDDGRDCYREFNGDMDEIVQVRAALEEDLRSALRTRDGLEVHYQPQFDGAGVALRGVEALARWRHPVRGSVSPHMFISIAEEAGLIVELGEWVLGEACEVALRWPDLSVAVNLSPAQFRTIGFAQRVTDLVTSRGVAPGQIELEVTEGMLIADDERVEESLQALRREGFRIALDDFGTGYSSLSYLRRFEVDKIKIDRSFVQQLGQTMDSTAIISAVVTLGHAMGLAVTAEGVETREQRDLLSHAGCNELQGFLFSGALPGDQLDRLLSELKQQAAA